MVLTLDHWLQLLASAFTLLSWWKMGDKAWYAPALAVIGELVWIVMIWHGALWGLLPLTATLMIVHVRNFVKWRVT